MTYDEELTALSAAIGGRNRRLLGIAIKGRLAGRDAETMVGEIVAASGTPPLSAAEVRRAVDKAMKVAIYKPNPCKTPCKTGQQLYF